MKFETVLRHSLEWKSPVWEEEKKKIKLFCYSFTFLIKGRVFLQQLPRGSVISKLIQTSIQKKQASLGLFWEASKNIDLNYFINGIFRSTRKVKEESFCNRICMPKRRQMRNIISSIKAVYEEDSSISFILIWGTWGMERWSDLSETQQNRYRSLSRLLHFRIYDKWHMAVYLLLICLMLNLWSWRFWNCLKHKTQTDFVILMIYGAILCYILYIMMWFGNLIWISSGSLLLVIIFFFFLSMDLC